MTAAYARKKFLHYFPRGFTDTTYIDWERGYKERAHERWQSELGEAPFRALRKKGAWDEIARRAVAIEARTNLLYSFEKMALRDAVRTGNGARAFGEGLFELLHGPGDLEQRFDRWCQLVDALPRKQTRVMTWPIVTVFGFLAQPDTHIFLKPNITKNAAASYGARFAYTSRPGSHTYVSMLAFAERVRSDLSELRPRDMIDLQSFIWVLGSDEYPELRKRPRPFDSAAQLQ